jgi:phosphatidylinositol N-acetylglucosaminyltransferase subunit Q
MPVSLQESASFIILGDCVVHHSGGLKEGCCSKLEQLPYDAKFVQKENFDAGRNNVSGTFVTEEQSPGCNDRKWVCDLGALDGFLDAYRKSAVKEGTWMHLFSITGKSFKRDLNQVPVLHHLYLRGQQIEMNHCHVCKSLIYDMLIF